MYPKCILFLLLTLVNGANAFAQKLVEKQLPDGKVTMLLPEGFVLMNDSLMKLKYPSEQRPKLVYTDKRGTVNLSFSHTEHKASQPEIENMVLATKQMYTNAQPSVKWLSHGVKTVNGRVFGYLEMITPALDTRIYNLMYFTDIDGRMAIFSFNCIEKYMKDWKDDAHAIMESLEVH